MKYQRDFHGWLTFFFVSTCIGVLLRCYTLFHLAVLLVGTMSLSPGVAVICSLVAAILIIIALLLGSIYGLNLFINDDSRTPAFWSRYLLVQPLADVGFFLCLALHSSVLSQMSYASAVMAYVTPRVFQSIAIMLCWALYWMRSKQVRAKFGYAGFGPATPATATVRAA